MPGKKGTTKISCERLGRNFGGEISMRRGSEATMGKPLGETKRGPVG